MHGVRAFLIAVAWIAGTGVTAIAIGGVAILRYDRRRARAAAAAAAADDDRTRYGIWITTR